MAKSAPTERWSSSSSSVGSQTREEDSDVVIEADGAHHQPGDPGQRREVRHRALQRHAHQHQRLLVIGLGAWLLEARAQNQAATGEVASTSSTHHQEKSASLPFFENRPTEETARTLRDELLFQRATQTYLWVLPLINLIYYFRLRDGELGLDVRGFVNGRIGSAFRVTKNIQLGLGLFTGFSQVDEIAVAPRATARTDFYGVHVGSIYSNLEVDSDREIASETGVLRDARKRTGLREL